MSTNIATERSEASLTWVIVDGIPRHVTEFAALPPRGRPAAFCQTCGERLTLKLGEIRQHHAAHRAGATCPTTNPETALHSDCKLAVAAALRAAASPTASLTFRLTCIGSESDECSRTSIGEWTGGWDEVRIEQRVDMASRPDILLLRDGLAVGAIEIVVSHRVEAAAASALARLGIPWAEIEADPRLCSSAAWDLGDAIDARRLNDSRRWRCDVHASMFAMRTAAAVVHEPEPDFGQTRESTLRSARVVDLYHPGGGHERFIYRVVEERIDGEPARVIRLLRGTLEIAAIPAYDGADPRGAMSRIIQARYDADVKRLRRDEATIVDSPMQWARGGAAEFITMEAVFDQRRPDPTVLATTYPRRWFYSPASREWFLPGDMLDVRWDRASDDPFAAHPASRRRGTGNISAAPEGSWSTPVFARRPTLVAFGIADSATELVPGVARVDITLESRGRRRNTSTERIVCIVTGDVDDSDLRAAIEIVRAVDNGADAVWLSSPRDWRPELEAVAWVAAGCDSRGRGGVIVDGHGLFRADGFMRAIARGDKRFSSANLRRAMGARVARLAARR